MEENKTQVEFLPIEGKHEEILLPLVELFYSSDAVDHSVPRKILAETFSAVADPENPLITGFLMEKEGEIAGFFYVTFFYACEVGGMCVMIEEIFLKKEFQGQGLGGRAMKWIQGQYPQAKRFRLEVTKSNQGAVALYEKLGYQFMSYDQMILDV